jgi:two-component system nitrogen regulation sensor histidine kinase NtrY
MIKQGKYIQIAIIAFILAILSNTLLSYLDYGQKDLVEFQRILNNKFSYLDKEYDKIKGKWQIDNYKRLSDNGIIILIYRNDSLICWSDNSISFSNIYNPFDFNNPLVFLSNSYYAVKEYKYNEYVTAGFILIKREFPYENNSLKNTFHEDFKLPSSAEIVPEGISGSNSIYDWDNKYLFTLIFGREPKYPELMNLLPPALYLFSLIFILLYISSFINNIKNNALRNWIILLTAIVFIVFRFISARYKLPASVYNLELFGPLPFAKSKILSSLGDMLINSLLLTFLTVKFNRNFYFSEKLFAGNRFKSYSLQILLFIGLIAYSLFLYFMLISLIYDSSISYEAYKVTGLSTYSFIGLLIFALYFTSLILIIDKILEISKKSYTSGKLIFVFTLVLIAVFTAGYSMNFKTDIYSGLFLFIIFIAVTLLKYNRDNIYRYSSLVLLVLIFAVYTIYFTSYINHQKEQNSMKIHAENLAAEHDPVAEYLLERISQKMTSDKRLLDLLIDLNYSSADIYSYLQKKYFTGFWNKYNMRFIDCLPYDSIYFEIPEKAQFHCYDFYDEVIDNVGIRLPNSKFYYLDNLNGRINYLGRLKYTMPDSIREITLFIELESRLVSEELGYPELLLDGRFAQNTGLSELSYAKYYKDRLIAQSGNFMYALNPDIYGDSKDDYSFLNYDGFVHLIYNIDQDNTIILSKPAVTFFNLLVSFSYVFVFYYILVAASLLLINFSKLDKRIMFNFKNKIQFFFISILFLSLILIGGGTIYFSIKQYQKKHDDNLREKIQSVYVELDHKLAFLETLSPDWSADKYDNLDQLLIKFSEVFYTDINLYDPDGNLLATSRPEIFERGLQGEKMNPIAYEKMVIDKQAEFVHHEKIGSLDYLSAYVPFINVDNDLLAYLNLPYFTKQNLLKKEIINLAVAIVNVFMLLILLTVAIAIFISGQITKPLSLIQQKFSKIKLGKKYEQIQYDRNDEISSLVSEYNRMVKELAESVELLAKSERESAWREMAKQIAHEIKNPLTPMKLSVQHLLRSWKDGEKNYDNHIDKVAGNLIEQIDNLSAIASEFSNFAQMPKAKNQKIDLVQKIKNSVDLLSSTKNVTIKTNFHNNKSVPILGDKEQLSRLYINLLKNAIQSIPENIKGIIEVDLTTVKNKALVKIRDNGKGIPDELKEKLFMPNFTTKSSGMGMGLAIVKNIIENCNGSIDFETEFGKGTTFTLEFPVYKE